MFAFGVAAYNLARIRNMLRQLHEPGDCAWPSAWPGQFGQANPLFETRFSKIFQLKVNSKTVFEKRFRKYRRFSAP
jgi:hypothetical protein